MKHLVLQAFHPTKHESSDQNGIWRLSRSWHASLHFCLTIGWFDIHCYSNLHRQCLTFGTLRRSAMIWSWFRWFFERYLGLILYTPSTRVQAFFLWLPVILDLRPPREGNMVLGLKMSDKTDKSLLGRTKPLSTTTPANSHDIVSQNQHYPMAPRCFNKQFNIYKHWETHVLPSSDILGPGTPAKKWSSSRRAARRRLRATRAKQRIKHVQTYMGLRAFQLVWQYIYIYIWKLLPAQTREVCSEIGSIWLCYMLCSAMSFG